MDSTALVFLAATAALIALIYALTKYSLYRKQTRIKNALDAKLREKGLRLGLMEIWNRNVIALDENGKHLFLMKEAGKNEQFYDITLQGFKKCKARNTGRSVSYKGSNQNVTDKLELEFFPVKEGDSHTFLEIYNAGEGIALTVEWDLTERWAQQANDRCNGHRD